MLERILRSELRRLGDPNRAEGFQDLDALPMYEEMIVTGAWWDYVDAIAFKADTDLDLLYDCIEPSLSSREFFLRKAIGWALRQYAWTDPREIRCYVRKHEEELSGVSKREALKNV